MGGILILLSISLAMLLWGDLSVRFSWVLLFVSLSFGTLGYVDDYLKISKKNSDGLSAGTKSLVQSALALSVLMYLYNSGTLIQEST